MEKASIATTAAIALLLPVVAPKDASAIGLLLPAVQKVEQGGDRPLADPGTYGFAFEVLEPVRVDALGISTGAGPRGGTVVIWDHAFSVIVQADVPTVLPFEQFSFNWARVQATRLGPGTYVIGASYAPGGLIPLGVDGIVRPDIRWLEGRQGIGEGAIPRERTDEFGPLGVLWANFATVVPEPAAWGLLIAGFGVMGLALRQRRRAAAAGGHDA